MRKRQQSKENETNWERLVLLIFLGYICAALQNMNLQISISVSMENQVWPPGKVSSFFYFFHKKAIWSLNINFTIALKTHFRFPCSCHGKMIAPMCPVFSNLWRIPQIWPFEYSNGNSFPRAHFCSPFSQKWNRKASIFFMLFHLLAFDATSIHGRKPTLNFQFFFSWKRCSDPPPWENYFRIVFAFMRHYTNVPQM